LRLSSLSTLARTLSILACIAGATPVVATEKGLPAGAVPLLAAELYSLYGGRTWRWGDTGGAYFGIEGRRFIAYSVKDDAKTIAAGKWRITDKGRLCFVADWINATGSHPATTCYLHAAVNGDVYQRSLPNGQWYLFKHAKTQPDDQYSKLVHEDLVSANLDNSQ
jgi:hypothetical protein